MNGALASLSLHGYGVLYLLVCMLHSIVCTIGLLCVIKRHVGYGFGFEGTEDGGFPEQLSSEGMHGALPHHGKHGKFSRQQHKTTLQGMKVQRMFYT